MYALTLNKVKNKEATVGIIGLGYVGLPLALAFAEEGVNVIGFDIDSRKIDSLNSGNSYIQHIPSERIKGVLRSKLSVTDSFKDISLVDAIIICVPTPLNKYREPDLSYIWSTLDSVLPYLKAGQILSLESTTYPGTTDEELKPRIEKLGFKIGEDFFLVFSPEREDPGRVDFNTKTIPKVLGGCTKQCSHIGATLYELIVDKVVPVSSTKAAELTKLLENIHRAVNIGLVNEMKVVADRMGIDIFEVIDAAATKPFGFVPYKPGPGIGGHCIPIDPFYLTWKAREYGLHTRFIELAGEINSQMPHYVLDKVSNALNNSGKSVKGANILLLGIAYKKNVDDARESPAIDIMQLLADKGAIVDYSDPFFNVFPQMRHHTFNNESVKITKDNLKKYDLVLIATDHDDFDYSLIKDHSKMVIDTRGRYRGDFENVVKA
ncbi:MAG: nucleotide sugar dehydrogenase [Bacteriovoracaceae bacterium]